MCLCIYTCKSIHTHIYHDCNYVCIDIYDSDYLEKQSDKQNKASLRDLFVSTLKVADNYNEMFSKGIENCPRMKYRGYFQSI